MNRRGFLKAALAGGAGLAGIGYPENASAFFWRGKWDELPNADKRGNLSYTEILAAQHLDELIERGRGQRRDLRPVADSLWRDMGKNDDRITERELYILKTVASKDTKYPKYPEYAIGKKDGDHSDYTGEAAIRALRPDYDIEAFDMLHEEGIKGGLIDASLGLEVKEVLVEPNLNLPIRQVGYNLVKGFPNTIMGKDLQTPLSRVDAYRKARNEKDVDCERSACLAITALENNNKIEWARLWWGNFSKNNPLLNHRSCIAKPKDEDGLYSVFDVAEKEEEHRYAHWFPNLEAYEIYQEKRKGRSLLRNQHKIWTLDMYIAVRHAKRKILESVVLV